MNCANHADASAVAYCRTCGKALCANCTRPVRGVIYCEDCLGARMEAGTTVPPASASAFVAGQVPPGAVSPGSFPPGRFPNPSPVVSGGGPNPTVAGILAGFFPFGVGAVYTGQYAKGLAHLAIMTLLIAGASAGDHGHSEALGVICGLGIAFFYVYQIIDSVRTARAIQLAQPVPDPFGLAATFSSGTRIETGKIPMGAIVLILIGVLFLLNTMGLTEYGLDRYWPLILIAVGGWLFARNWGLTGRPCAGCQCARCRTRRIMGPAVLLTVGVLFMLENLRLENLEFGHTWPVLLLVIGAVKLLQANASIEGHNPTLGLPVGTTTVGAPIPPPAPPIPPVPPTGEVNRG